MPAEIRPNKLVTLKCKVNTGAGGNVIAIHHIHITPEKKLDFQRTIQHDPLLCTLANTIVAGWPEDIKDIPKALCPYHNHHDVMTVEDGLILKGEVLIIPPLEREKILQAIHKGHMGITKCQYHARQCVYWPRINEDIRKMVEACPTCQCHHPQEPWQPLQPTPVPKHPWQHIGADFFTFDGFEYLVIIDYYTKMPFIRKIPLSHCNAAKTILFLKELFFKYGILETIRSDNDPQFASHQFTEFAKEWNFDHTTSSPRKPRSNGKAEAAFKVAKGLLNHTKYSGQDPYLALLAYRSTPFDANLCSPAEMLYQRVIRTTVPQRIRHKDPKAAADQDHLNDCATHNAVYHDHHWKPKSLLYAGQSVSVLNDAKTLWLPATEICQAHHGSYLVQVIGGGQYRCAHHHIHECHPDTVKPDMPVNTDVAPSYTRVLIWVVPSETSASSTSSPSSPSHCTSCSSKTQTTTSCTPSYHTNGHSKETTNCSCSTESIHWKCHKGDWHSTHCHLPTNQSQEASRPSFLRRCDLDCPWLMNISCTSSKLITSPTFCS